MDTDKSGVIEAEELKAALRAVGQHPQPLGADGVALGRVGDGWEREEKEGKDFFFLVFGVWFLDVFGVWVLGVSLRVMCFKSLFCRDWVVWLLVTF